ncbi:MAG: acyltransferase [Actinomycetia bacterium]|nr:acyltransferase [Actinomycetes bacterium]
MYAPGKRRDLQGMRAFAVLVVFANHLFEWPRGGFVGVDVFFVLSGFFITGLLLREHTANGELSFKNFYMRRAKRIIPSALLVLAVTVIGGYLLFPAVRAKDTLVDALYAAVFGANIHFQAIGADYFQQNRQPSPIQHYWSLSIEEQFYFVWPALLVLMFALTRRWSRTRWVQQWGLFAAMALVVAASFSWAMYLTASDVNAAYFSTFTRVWELGVGALVAICGPWLFRIPDPIRPVLAYVGLAGVAASLFLIDGTAQFPAPWAALPVASTALVVASFHGGTVRAMPMLTNPVARWFGDTSYTLYLWHWPVIILLLAVLPTGVTFYVAAVVLSIGLTALTYHYYEDPIRKSGWLTESKLNPGTWGVAAASMAVIVVASILEIDSRERLAQIKRETQQEAQYAAITAPPPPGPAVEESSADTIAPLTSPLPGNGPCFGAPAMLDTACILRNPDEPLTPSIDTFTDDRTPREIARCWSEKHAKTFVACTQGYSGADATRVALVGDSHAAGLMVALTPYLEVMKWQLTIYTGWGCAWKTPAQEECRDALTEMQRRMLADPYDIIVTTSARRQNAGRHPAHYADAWKPVADAGSRIAVIGDNPEIGERALACMTRANFSGQAGECDVPRREALAMPDPLIAAAGMVPGATVIDLTQYFCGAEQCPVIIGDVIVYWDANHPTATYMRTLAPAIVDGIRQIIARPATR